LRGTERDEEALQNLLEIYQQEKEWAKAVTIANAMPNHSDHIWPKEIAEFHCEMAVNEMLHDRHDEARRLLNEALAANRKCIRATLLLGELAAKVGAGDTAIDHWKSIEQQNPVYLSLAAEKLMVAHNQLGRKEQGVHLLRGWLERHPSLDLLDAVFRVELETGGAEAAYTLVRDELRRNPTLLGLDKLLEAQILVVPPERRPDLELIKNLIHNHTRRVARYRCDACGFKARQFYWRCPGCGGWETYPPRRTEEFDITL